MNETLGPEMAMRHAADPPRGVKVKRISSTCAAQVTRVARVASRTKRARVVRFSQMSA